MNYEEPMEPITNFFFAISEVTQPIGEMGIVGGSACTLAALVISVVGAAIINSLVWRD